MSTCRTPVLTLPRPFRLLPPLALSLLLIVSCQGPRWQMEDSDGTRWTRKGNEWSIRQVDPYDDSVLTAELKVEREESDGVAHYRLIEVDLFPPGDPMPRLWRLLPPRSQLRSPDGTVLTHPDLKQLSALGATPTLADALETIPFCLHYASRGEALALVAGGPSGRTEFAELLEVIEAGSAGPLGDAPFDGVQAPLGGRLSEGRVRPLQRLVSRADLLPDQYDRLAGLAKVFPSNRLAVQYLGRLVGRASTVVLADATDAIPTARGRATILQKLIREGDLNSEEVTAICSATTQVSSSSAQTAVLLELAPLGPIGPILDAATHVRSSSGKTEIFLTLARRRPLTSEDAATILGDTPGIGSISGQTSVVETLVDLAPVSAVLDATSAIASSSGRSAILGSLAERPKLTREEARSIAQATAEIGSSSGQTSVLSALVGSAPSGDLIRAAQQVASTSGRTQVLLTLARHPSLTEEEGGKIAAATPFIGSSSGQTEVLLALIGRAPLTEILEANGEVSSTNGRATLLLRAASQPNLDGEAAAEIARALTQLHGSPGSAGQVFRRLNGHLSVEAMISASDHIRSHSERFEALLSVARRPNLAAEDAVRLADAALTLDSTSRQAALLEALIGMASPDALRERIERIGSERRREQLLETLRLRVERRQRPL